MGVDAELFADRLPTYLTRFVGRRGEVSELVGMLADRAAVTLCGVGGAGKTRLAIEVARSWAPASGRYETFWVPLTAVGTDRDVNSATAAALETTGEVDADDNSPITVTIGDRPVLLVLDNCEQVAAGCRRLITDVVQQCPSARILLTSRIPIGAEVEYVYPVPPLGSGGTDAGDHPGDAAALFLDRSQRLAPVYDLTMQNTETVEQICRLLGGLPLAIELAASWVHVLSARDLLTHIDRTRSDLAARTATIEPRHRHLDTVLDATWSVLSDRERDVMTAMSVFVGGFTPAAALAVAGADLAVLASLTERLVIQRMPDSVGGTRYQMHELIRADALSRVDQPDILRRRHLDYYLELTADLWLPELTVVEMVATDPLREDFANIDAAGRWAIEQRDTDAALRMALVVDHFWVFSIPSSAVRDERLDAALALPWRSTGRDSCRVRGRALEDKGLTSMRWAPERALACFAEGRRLMRLAADRPGEASCVRAGASAHLILGEYAAARREAAEGHAMSESCGDHQGAAWALVHLGAALRLLDRYDEAITTLQEVVTDSDDGVNPYIASHARVWLADTYRVCGRWSRSAQVAEIALRALQRDGLATETAELMDVLAGTAVAIGADGWAAELCGLAAAVRRVHREEPWLPVDRGLEVWLSRGRRRFGSTDWEAAYADGQGLGFTTAVQRAIDIALELQGMAASAEAGLTEREREVLRLVADGLSNADIADRLVLSPRTVHAHLRSIFGKLGVSSRTAAVQAAEGRRPARDERI